MCSGDVIHLQLCALGLGTRLRSTIGTKDKSPDPTIGTAGRGLGKVQSLQGKTGDRRGVWEGVTHLLSNIIQ